MAMVVVLDAEMRAKMALKMNIFLEILTAYYIRFEFLTTLIL